MISSIEKIAYEFCIKNKHRLTEPRKKVLSIIASSDKPIKAYDILKKLSLELKNPKPPTAYRAIDFWHKFNFIHRVERLNAYFICNSDHRHSGSQYMICDDCGKVIESHFCELPSQVKDHVMKSEFQTKTWSLEIKGRCNNCA